MTRPVRPVRLDNKQEKFLRVGKRTRQNGVDDCIEFAKLKGKEFRQWQTKKPKE